MISENQLKIQGRYAIASGELWMASSLCEAGFRVAGATYVFLCLKSDNTVTDPERQHLTPRYAIRVDGELIRDAHLTAPEEMVPVFEGQQRKRDAEVRLTKLSECTQSIMGLAEIRTDGEISPLPKTARGISFIGDSITCGYGVEAAGAKETFSTFTENAEKSYAGIMAAALGMDRELVCFSGHGIVSGYTGDPTVKNATELVPPYYEKAGRNGYRLPDGRLLEEIPWDFSLFQPEWIILSLGTNDLSWCKEEPERKALFCQGYGQFLETVRKNNPSAKILCVLGLLGTGLNEEVRQAAEKYTARTGDTKVHLLFVPTQNGERDGLGADEHPSEITQRLFAERIMEEIQQIDGLI